MADLTLLLLANSVLLVLRYYVMTAETTDFIFYFPFLPGTTLFLQGNRILTALLLYSCLPWSTIWSQSDLRPTGFKLLTGSHGHRKRAWLLRSLQGSWEVTAFHFPASPLISSPRSWDMWSLFCNAVILYLY